MGRKKKEENKQGHYQRVEKFLYRYKFMRMGLENMEEELEEAINHCGVGSADPGKENFNTNKFHSSVEDAAIQNIDNPEINWLKKNIDISKKKLDKLDKVISELSKEERDVIKSYYMDGKQWYEISKHLNYSERWCYSKRKQAIEKISLALGYSIAPEFETSKKKIN